MSKGPSVIVYTKRVDFTVHNVSTSAYYQVDTNLPYDVKELEIFNSSGSTLKLAVGATGGEQDILQIMPGGNGRIPCLLSAGSNLNVKAVDAAATTGELLFNGYR